MSVFFLLFIKIKRIVFCIHDSESMEFSLWVRFGMKLWSIFVHIIHVLKVDYIPGFIYFSIDRNRLSKNWPKMILFIDFGESPRHLHASPVKSAAEINQEPQNGTPDSVIVIEVIDSRDDEDTGGSIGVQNYHTNNNEQERRSLMNVESVNKNLMDQWIRTMKNWCQTRGERRTQARRDRRFWEEHSMQMRMKMQNKMQMRRFRMKEKTVTSLELLLQDHLFISQQQVNFTIYMFKVRVTD